MLKELLKNTKFMSEINNFFRGNQEEIIDIVLFGSAVTGKEKPKDIDLLIIFKYKENLELGYRLRKKLEKSGVEVEITAKTYKKLFDPNFLARESFLNQGYSLIQKKFIAQGLGYSNMVLFRYELKGLSKSKRMRFYYSLYGRQKKDKGMLKKLNAYKFSERVLIAPVETSEKMKDYLDSWNLDYAEIHILIPTRIIESEIF